MAEGYTPLSTEQLYGYQRYLQSLGTKRPGAEAAFDPQIAALSGTRGGLGIQAPNIEDLYEEFAPETSFWASQSDTPEGLLAQYAREGKSQSFLKQQIKAFEDAGVLDPAKTKKDYEDLALTFGKEYKTVQTQQKKADPFRKAGLPGAEERYDPRKTEEWKVVEEGINNRFVALAKDENAKKTAGYVTQSGWDRALSNAKKNAIDIAAEAFGQKLTERGRTPLGDALLQGEYLKATKGGTLGK